MDIELVLMEDVASLGEIGDLVRVRRGYARNYLIPRGLASKSSAAALRQIETKKARIKAEDDKLLAEAQVLGEKIGQTSATIAVQATDDDKLYGSVTAHQISSALTDMDIHVDRQKIALLEPIRELGVYSVEVHLHPEVAATLKVWVVKT